MRQLCYNNISLITVFDRMSTRGAHLILGPRGEAQIRTRRFFERGRSLNIFQKTWTYFSGKNNFFYLESVYKRKKEIMNSFLSEFFFNNNLKT